MNSTDFLTRLRQAEADTGLHQQQLGITRVYEHPHAATHATGHTSGHLSSEEILVKDLHQVRGEVTTFGSEHQARTAVEDDSATTTLLSTGATLVGASSTSEFGVMAYTEPVGQLAPINPVHPGMTPGGSSGGAAVAVSRGLVNIAHATDGGGSIRIPAACCGLPGLKPAHDPTYGGFTSTAHGFLAADLETTARAYDLPISDLAQRTSASPNKNPLRIGYTNTPFHSTSQVDPAIAAATAAVTALLTGNPAVEGVRQAPAPYPVGFFKNFATYLHKRCAPLPAPLSPLPQWLKEQGLSAPTAQVEQSVEKILALGPRVLQAWPDFDVIATPTLACAPPAPGTFSALPPRLDFLAQTAWTPWGTLWNMTGWASLTVPLVRPEQVPGRWPISLLLGAVSDRISPSELLALGQAAQTAAAALPPEGLSLAAPGNLDSLSFQPTPTPSAHEH